MRVVMDHIPLVIMLRDDLCEEGLAVYKIFDSVWYIERIESFIQPNGKPLCFIDLVEMERAA